MGICGGVILFVHEQGVNKAKFIVMVLKERTRPWYVMLPCIVLCLAMMFRVKYSMVATTKHKQIPPKIPASSRNVLWWQGI